MYSGNGSTASINYPPNATEIKAQRELKVPKAVEELEACIARVGKAAEELSLRLEKVCEPQSPTLAANPQEGGAMSVASHVAFLWQQSDKLRKIAELLENTLQRLEL